MDLDAVLEEIGDFGTYQKLKLWYILLPCVFPCGFHAYNQLFMAAEPNHWCKTQDFQNYSQEFVKNISIPRENYDGNSEFSKCYMYNHINNSIFNDVLFNNNSKSLKKISCQNGWVYDDSVYKSTVVTEWNLVCEKDFFTTLSLMLFGVGGLIGSLLFGYLQDSLGRKPSFYIYLIIQTLFGFATAFAPNYYIWTFFRTGVGFTIPAILATPCILSIELVGPDHRSTVTILVNIAYSIALTSLAIIVWAIRDWRILSLATTIPFLSLFLIYNYFPESPRWLLSQGKLDALEKNLKLIARTNGKKFRDSYMLALKENYNQEQLNSSNIRSYGILDLFSTFNMKCKTIIITFIWFANTSVYVGLSYYAPALGGDEFLNFFLAGIVELPTYIFLWPSMNKLGRRWSLCISMIIGGMACLNTFLVENNSTLTLCLYCLGKMGISSSFVILPLMASELYPTVVRGLGMSFSSVIGMLGPVFIPLINFMGSDMLTLPLIIMGFLLILGGASVLILPETLNQNLPQTMKDNDVLELHFFKCKPKLSTKQQEEIINSQKRTMA